MELSFMYWHSFAINMLQLVSVNFSMVGNHNNSIPWGNIALLYEQSIKIHKMTKEDSSSLSMLLVYKWLPFMK